MVNKWQIIRTSDTKLSRRRVRCGPQTRARGRFGPCTPRALIVIARAHARGTAPRSGSNHAAGDWRTQRVPRRAMALGASASPPGPKRRSSGTPRRRLAGLAGEAVVGQRLGFEWNCEGAAKPIGRQRRRRECRQFHPPAAGAARRRGAPALTAQVRSPIRSPRAPSRGSAPQCCRPLAFGSAAPPSDRRLARARKRRLAGHGYNLTGSCNHLKTNSNSAHKDVNLHLLINAISTHRT